MFERFEKGGKIFRKWENSSKGWILIYEIL